MPEGCRKSKQTSWGEGHSLPRRAGGETVLGLRRHIGGPGPTERPGMPRTWGRRPGSGGPLCTPGVATG